MRPTFCFLALTLAACGSDGVPGGDDPGDGSSTLEIRGDVRAENLVPNASDPNDFSTQVEVRVFRAGREVTDATVLLYSDSGEHEVPYAFDGEGRYRLNMVGYEERYILDVTAGDDFVTDVRVDGPSMHVFSTPTLGAEVQGGEPLTVEWDRADQADFATISTEAMDDVSIADSGSYVIPADGLRWEADKVESDRIRLVREDRLTPAGAVGESSFSVELRNQIDIAVLP